MNVICAEWWFKWDLNCNHNSVLWTEGQPWASTWFVKILARGWMEVVDQTRMLNIENAHADMNSIFN